ncbi:MAG: MFS transporter [Actinomycetota bacterium]|nr:MFS transporter [Actinomycetota bacterium]
MDATRPSTPVRRGRIWPLVTYPLRLGPSRPERPSGPFTRLAVVHVLSTAADVWVTVALAGSVFVSVSLHAARGRTALGLICTVLPFLVVGPFLGPVIERVSGGRRAIMAASSVGRLVACGFMASVIHTLWLFPAAFAFLVCSKTYLVSKASLVPSAVERDEELVEANSKLAIGSSVATSLAGLVGAGIYKVFGSPTVLHLNMVMLAVCAVLVMRLRPSRRDRLPQWPSTTWTTGVPPTFVAAEGASPQASSAAAGMRAARVRARRARSNGSRALPPGGLLLAGVAMTAMRAVAGLMTLLVIFAFRRDGAPLIWYGLAGVATVVGTLGGATLAPFVRDRVAEERIVPAAAFVIGAAAVAVTQLRVVHRWPAALILAMAVGVAASVGKMAFDAIVQRDPPEVARSRLFARSEAVFQLGWVLAALAPVLITMSLMTGFVVVAALSLGAGLIFIIGWHKARAGTLPSWWPVGAGSSPLAGAPGPAGSGPPDAHPPSALGGPVGAGPDADPTRVYPGRGPS